MGRGFCPVYPMLTRRADRFWARLAEICTFLSSTCHGGRGLPNSVFLGLFLKNNGPVWHFQPPVCSFWPAMGHFWHFRRPGLQQPHICNTQTAHPGQRKPPNVQTTNPFGHQCMARHHGALQRPMQGTWFGPQIWRVGHFAHSTAVSPLLPRLAAPAHLAQEQKWQNQPKCCATTLWGGNLAVVWGSGSQHGRFERYDKIGKMPLKKKTLDLATNSQKMRKIEKGQKCCATRVCLHMVKQRWANQHAHLQHTRYDNQNVQFWATLAQNTS